MTNSLLVGCIPASVNLESTFMQLAIETEREEDGRWLAEAS
jgi:hypothetical protein